MDREAVVVGAGPNGLAAAVLLAQHGWRVNVVEANAEPGGGVRSSESTLPGFIHDHCSSIYPLGAGSPFFRTLPLEAHGLEWVHPEIPLAHPLDDGTAVLLYRSLDETAEGLGIDGPKYKRLMGPLLENWDLLESDVLGPPIHLPRHPVLFARFGLKAVQSIKGLVDANFESTRAKALLAGLGAHSLLSLGEASSAAIGLVLGVLAHRVGWPMVKGGARELTNALVGLLKASGGSVGLNHRVTDLDELGARKARLLDVTPRQFLQLAGERLPGWYERLLKRYRYGAGAFKVDYALSGPIPWRSAECRRAATVHLGGTFEEICQSEQEVTEGRPPERPFVLLAQNSIFDASRAPAGRHTAWAYCHVPNGSDVDMTERIERQIERYAPGFRDLVLARTSTGPRRIEQDNANMIGGDLNGGRANFLQLVARPVPLLNPYRTPLKGVYLCSSSTPPGGGVHGMCGYHAARTVLKDFDR